MPGYCSFRETEEAQDDLRDSVMRERALSTCGVSEGSHERSLRSYESPKA